MAEWSIAAVLKTVEVRASGGSNPSLSAENESSNKKVLDYQLVKDFFSLNAIFSISPKSILPKVVDSRMSMPIGILQPLMVRDGKR